MEKGPNLNYPKSVKIFSLLPHRNICYKLRQMQNQLIYQFSNFENKFFPFLPIFSPIKIITDTFENAIPENINQNNFIIEKPCFKDSWIFCPIKIFTSQSEIFLTEEENADTNFSSSFSISDFPPFPQYQIIPLAFVSGQISETMALEINNILEKDFSPCQQNSFPINMNVFRMALLNFTWPLDDESLKKIGSDKNIRYSFNWQMEKAKWVKINKKN